MTRVTYGEVMEGRQRLADYLFGERSRGRFTVIDVGGSATGRSVPVADAFVDINPCDERKLQFNVDVCRESEWSPVLDYVSRAGKFDYCICTHTLEDLYNPYLVLDMLPRIARAGTVSTPSVASELSHVESDSWLGFAHHRYLFGHMDGKVLIAPKLPLVEKLASRKKTAEVEEVRFHWEGSIQYEKFMDNYLGPNTRAVIENYEKFIKEQQ